MYEKSSKKWILELRDCKFHEDVILGPNCLARQLENMIPLSDGSELGGSRSWD